MNVESTSRLGCGCLPDSALQGLIQPQHQQPKSHTERLFWDKATPRVTLEMFGDRLNKVK